MAPLHIDVSSATVYVIVILVDFDNDNGKYEPFYYCDISALLICNYMYIHAVHQRLERFGQYISNARGRIQKTNLSMYI